MRSFYATMRLRRVMSKPDGDGGAVFVVAGAETAWGEQIRDAVGARGALAPSVESADVILVVIGAAGVNQRLAPLIRRSLDRSKHLVPILVDEAGMPSERDLPASIAQLAYCHALRLQDEEAIPGVIARAVASRREASGGRATSEGRTTPLVFVSYRRDDSGYWADLLARALMRQLESAQIWFDRGSERAGADYRAQLDWALSVCRRFVVVVGPAFLERNGAGHRRIDDPDDWVRAEIRAALGAGKPIHVVLTGNAEMPGVDNLPDELEGLGAVRSVSSLNSHDDAERVAREIATAAIDSRLLRQLDLFRTRDPATPSARLMADWRATRKALELRAKSVVQELGEYGWHVTSGHTPQHSSYELVRDTHPDLRFVVESGKAEVLLQERTHALRAAGLRRWTDRAVFPVSPRSPNTLALQQLPDRLVEAALDPDGYLDRIGRRKVTKRFRSKFMSEDVLLGNIEAMGMRPPPDAVEGYQRSLRESKARGGLSRLRLESDMEISDVALPTSLAMHPRGPLAAIATDQGLFLVDAATGKRVRLEPSRSYASVAFSRTGRLAAGTESGRVDAWDTDGTVLVRGSTPYTFSAKVGLRGVYAGRSLQGLAWSDDGKRLAGAAADAVWVWRADGFGVSAWRFPGDPRQNLKRGALFSPDGERLLVFGLFQRLFLIDVSRMEAIGAVQFEGMPSLPDQWVEGKEPLPPSPAAFQSINAAALKPDGTLVACAGTAGQTALCDLKTMRLAGKLTWHQPTAGTMLPISNALQSIGFSPDGRWLASVGQDRRIIVGDTESWQATHSAHLEGISTREMLAWSSDSASIATVNRGRLQIWRL